MKYCPKCKRDLPDGEKCPVCKKKKGVWIEMEMPESCFDCNFRIGYHCVCSEEKLRDNDIALKKKVSWCPLQEVKELEYE